jgi:hypothetical protein
MRLCAGTRVTVKSKTGQWDAGVVISVEPEPAIAVRVRFDGDRAEEVASVLSYSVRDEQTNLFDPAPAAVVASGKFDREYAVDVRDENYAWYTGLCDGVNVTYDGWPDRYKEKITLPSPRVAVLHTHTMPGFKSQPNKIGVVVPPDVGSAVLVKLPEADTAVCAKLVSREEHRVGIQVEGKAELTWLPLPLAIGVLFDTEPQVLALDRISGTTYGGIKFMPKPVPTLLATVNNWAAARPPPKCGEVYTMSFSASTWAPMEIDLTNDDATSFTSYHGSKFVPEWARPYITPLTRCLTVRVMSRFSVVLSTGVGWSLTLWMATTKAPSTMVSSR